MCNRASAAIPFISRVSINQRWWLLLLQCFTVYFWVCRLVILRLTCQRYDPWKWLQIHKSIHEWLKMRWEHKMDFLEVSLKVRGWRVCVGIGSTPKASYSDVCMWTKPACDQCLLAMSYPVTVHGGRCAVEGLCIVSCNSLPSRFYCFMNKKLLKKKNPLYPHPCKNVRFSSWDIPHPHSQFYWNPSCSFCVILPTDKQKYSLLSGGNICTSVAHS